jgi:hypothetical protein
VVGANNKYDQQYMQYFTGLTGVQLFSSLCETFVDSETGETSEAVTYKPSRPELLIAPARDVHPVLSARLITELTGPSRGFFTSLLNSFSGEGEGRSAGFTVKHIHDLYPHFEYSDLASHPAVLLLPYQVSFMLFFELYAMNVPMFVPSPALLTEWHLEHSECYAMLCYAMLCCAMLCYAMLCYAVL